MGVEEALDGVDGLEELINGTGVPGHSILSLPGPTKVASHKELWWLGIDSDESMWFWKARLEAFRRIALDWPDFTVSKFDAEFDTRRSLVLLHNGCRSCIDTCCCWLILISWTGIVGLRGDHSMIQGSHVNGDAKEMDAYRKGDLCGQKMKNAIVRSDRGFYEESAS